MHFKAWPLYNDWSIIFGKDRAQGDHGIDLEENYRKGPTLKEKDSHPKEDFLFGEEQGGDYVPDMEFNDNLEHGPDINISMSNGQSSAPSKSKSSNKRKAPTDGFDSQFFDIMSNFSSMADLRLGKIAKRIGHEHERAANSRNALNDALVDIPDLSVENRILAANVLVKDIEKLDYFFSLPNEDRVVMIQMIVARNI